MKNTKTTRTNQIYDLRLLSYVVWVPLYKGRVESSLMSSSECLLIKRYPSASNNFNIISYDKGFNAQDIILLDRRKIISSITLICEIIRGHTNCQSICNDIKINKNSRSLRHKNHRLFFIVIQHCPTLVLLQSA